MQHNLAAALLDRLRTIEAGDPARFERLRSAIESDGRDAAEPPTIAVFDAKAFDLDAFEEANGGRFQLKRIKDTLSTQTAGAAAGAVAACIFVNDRCDAAEVQALASVGVGLIALRCAGYNNVDLQACADHGIDVVRVPAYSPHAVAEHTIALALMLNRHLHIAYLRNRTGAFTLDGLTGFDMHGKTVGVIGTGQIGRCVIDAVLGFGCRVVAFDAYPNEAFAQQPNVEYASLDALLAQSDIVSLHVPLMEATHHLIDHDAIEKMKPGAMLINTSRGGLIDTRALIDGLKSGRIGAAGLDVYEEEAGIFFRDLSSQVLTDDVLARLMSFNNVVVTSHQAFLTREALTAIAETTLASVAEYLAGRRGDELTHRVS
ncbi:MAG: 2-hydroxyacid dehydrogenase [Planctomycetota bacterium]